MLPENTARAQAVVRPLTIKDLRVQCRARGISPAGGRDTLAQRLEEHMAATGDLCVFFFLSVFFFFFFSVSFAPMR